MGLGDTESRVCVPFDFLKEDMLQAMRRTVRPYRVLSNRGGKSQIACLVKIFFSGLKQ